MSYFIDPYTLPAGVGGFVQLLFLLAIYGYILFWCVKPWELSPVYSDAWVPYMCRRGICPDVGFDAFGKPPGRDGDTRPHRFRSGAPHFFADETGGALLQYQQQYKCRQYFKEKSERT